MLSEELYIMDKNMERMMVSELQDEVNALKAERDAAEKISAASCLCKGAWISGLVYCTIDIQLNKSGCLCHFIV